MLKEFIEHIQKTTQPLITNVNGSAFCVTSDGTEGWGDLNATQYGQMLASKARLVGMAGSYVI